MKRVSTIITLVLFFCVATMAKNDPGKVITGTYKVVPVSKLDYVSYHSVVYALPKTELHLEVTAEKTTKIRGPFYQYSERYLGLKDVVTEDQVNWELINVDMNTRGVPDETKRFAVVWDGPVAASFISHSCNGCIASVNCADMPAAKKNIEKEIIINNSMVSFDFVPYTEEMLIANSTAKMAEEAASYITRIRENRTLLLSGEATNIPGDGKGMELALKKMDELEQQYLELFKGKIIKEVVTKNIVYMPNEETERELLFRFSKFNGIVSKDDLSGQPVTLQLKFLSKVDLPNAQPQPEIDHKGNVVKPAPEAGFYYTLPGTVGINLLYANTMVFSGTFKMAQFGQLLNLPNSILKKPDEAIRFVPETGEIKAIIKK